MIPYLGAEVAALPLAPRALAYTTAWVAHWFVVQTAVWALLKTYERWGWVKKNTRDPALPLWKMLTTDVMGYYGWAWGIGLAHAWYNPTWETWDFTFDFPKLFWGQVPIMLAYDMWFFFVHRYCHINKWLFAHVHAMHHRSDAYLNVTSNSFEHPVDGFFAVVIPTGLIAWLGLWTGNFWAMFFPLHLVACVFVFGHSGYQLNLIELHELAFLLINPMLAVLHIAPNTTRPMDHEDHHTNPRCNFSAFFTFWDDMYGTAYPKKQGVPLLTWLVCVSFYLFTSLADVAMTRIPAAFLLAALLHALTPVPALTYKLLGGAVSRWVSRLPIWDRLRREALIEYAAPGEPGHLAVETSRRYVFCYQPMGVQARGAWYTFAGKGRASPVSPLHTVKLAVGRWIWPLIGGTQLLALYDCCDSSYRTLKGVLTAREPRSVCITVGGFREAKYLQSYRVAVRCRRGFARLAAETGAALVPVIGVGEPYLAGEATLGARLLKLFAPYRPHAIKVVFGEPIQPKDGEDAEKLHERYCRGLLALAKQHDVPLEIVE